MSDDLKPNVLWVNQPIQEYMTKREHIAAMMAQGLLGQRGRFDDQDPDETFDHTIYPGAFHHDPKRGDYCDIAESLADDAVILADALLKALEAKP